MSALQHVGTLVLIVAVPLAGIAYLFLGPLVHRAPLQDADTSRLDALDGVKPAKCCTVPFCDDPVQIHLHVGNDWWLFCMTHGLPYLTGQPYDQEAAS